MTYDCDYHDPILLICLRTLIILALHTFSVTTSCICVYSDCTILYTLMNKITVSAVFKYMKQNYCGYVSLEDNVPNVAWNERLY